MELILQESYDALAFITMVMTFFLVVYLFLKYIMRVDMST